MNPASIAIGVLLITVFLVSVIRGTRHITEGFASKTCGQNNNEVYDSSAKKPTGPLQNCPVGSKLFYSQLARIKGTKNIDPKMFSFRLPGGVDPVKNLVPGTVAYNAALRKTGTAFLDPSNWSILTTVPGVTQTPPSTSTTTTTAAPKNTGVVPNTMPGSTTNNSKDGLANVKDLIAFRDTLKTFSELFERNLMLASRSTDLQFLHANAISFGIKIQAQIDTGSIVDSQQFVSTQRAIYEKAIRDLRQGKIPAAPKAKQTKEAPTKKSITLQDVEDAILRARAEKKRIDNLRTTSTDLRKRASTLDMIILDLTGMVDRIRRGDMKIAQLPFTWQQLNRFLMEVRKADSSKITPLPRLKRAEPPRPAPKKPTGAPTRPAAPVPGQFPLPGVSKQQYTAAIRQFQNATKDLTWDINIGYDPNTTIRRETLERLTFVTNQIESGKVKGDLLKAYMLELQALRNQVARTHRRPISAYERFEQPEASVDVDESFTINTQVPVKQELVSNLTPQGSADWRKRPGYEWTPETLAKRGSMATFDDSKLGGLDYKKTVQHLCNQIRDAGLGEPTEFGCVKNPATDVAPDYSWRGNYRMVCNRLSRTWGNFYPQMFGCPEEDIAQLQTPVIRLDK